MQKPRLRNSLHKPLESLFKMIFFHSIGIQSIRRSVLGPRLPSARKISVHIHGERDNELPTVTLMLMQWGQFIDHDVTSVVKSRSFNGSIPRCCDRGGRSTLPQEFTVRICVTRILWGANAALPALILNKENFVCKSKLPFCNTNFK